MNKQTIITCLRGTIGRWPKGKAIVIPVLAPCRNGGAGANLHSFRRCRNGCLYQEEVKSVLCHFVSIASTNQALYDIPKFLHIFR